MNKNKEKIKKKTIIMTIIGIAFMLVLILTSTYAYFMVNATSSTSSTVITSHTEKVATASLNQKTTTMKLNLSALNMNKVNVGNYYADDENDYAPNKSLGYHELSTLTLTNSNEDNNIYKCNMNVQVTFDTDSNSLGSVIEKDDMFVHFMIGNQNYEYDLSEYKSTGSLSQTIETELIGNSDKILYGYVELRNRDANQSYLANKNISVTINTTLNKCELTGKEGVYAVLDNKQNGEIYRSTDYRDKIKKVSFVNYVDNDYENKTHWDLSKKQDESIIGWLEENGDSEVPYNLYIGTQKSNQVIFAKAMSFAFYNMREVTEFDFSNLNTSMTIDMLSTFREVTKVITLDLSSFDTSKVTTMNTMFIGNGSLETINLSSFNTSNVQDMNYTFGDSGNLKNIDLSNFNTSKATNFSIFFINNKKLENVDLTSFDFSKSTSISGFFNNSGVRNINLRNLRDNGIFKNSSDMFKNMNNLETLDIRNMDFTKFTKYENMFTGTNTNPTIYVKDEANKSWIEARLAEAGVSANVIIPS